MAIKRYILSLTNDAVDPSNPQQFSFVMDNVFTDADNAARCLAYWSNQSNTCAANTRVTGVTVRAAGSAGATDIPFPVTEFADLKTLGDANGFGLTTQSAYGLALGTGSLCPLGTSVSVSERTATVGPTGRGRHFWPFIQEGIVTGGGRLAAATITSLTDSYNYWFLAADTLPNAANTGVSPGDLATIATITSVKPQPVFSNLESRRR